MARSLWLVVLLALVAAGCADNSGSATIATTSTTSAPTTTTTTTAPTTTTLAPTTTTAAPEVDLQAVEVDLTPDFSREGVEDLDIESAAGRLGGQAEDVDLLEEVGFVRGQTTVWVGSDVIGDRVGISITLMAFEDANGPGTVLEMTRELADADPDHESFSIDEVPGAGAWQALPGTGIRGASAWTAIGRVLVIVSVDGGIPDGVRQTTERVFVEQVESLEGT